jgi:hypothetical protein
MEVQKILIEYAKLHLQLVQANETIAALKERNEELVEKVKELTPKSE